MNKIDIPNVTVRPVTSKHSGEAVRNQFIIETDKGVFFQSYRTLIAYKPYFVHGNEPEAVLDPNWDCSVTTGKYRNQFLGEDVAETRRKIKEGRYVIQNLNS